MKYIKLFENNAAYQAYADSAEYVEPHVSLAVEENEVHYNKPPKTPKWIATYQDAHTESAECDSSGEIVQGEIGDSASVVSLEIGDCVTSIANNGLRYFGYTSITIPNSVISIGEYGLSGCDKLTNVTIGSGVTSIGNSCFFWDNALTNVTILATTPPSLGDSVFGSTHPIYVPAESVDAYKAAWPQYADRIQPIV